MNKPVLKTRRNKLEALKERTISLVAIILLLGGLAPADISAMYQTSMAGFSIADQKIRYSFSEDMSESRRLFAAESLQCIGFMQISIGTEGYAVIAPSNFVIAGDISNAITIINGVERDSIFCDEVGMSLIVEVRDTITTQNCWSTAIIEDKLSPYISCDTARFSCTIDPFDPSLVTSPDSVSDNCGTPGLSFNDSPYSAIDCNGIPAPEYTGQFTRTWTATDASGNSAQCEQIVVFERLPLDSVDCPVNDTMYCPTYNLDPSVTGRPNYNGQPLNMQCGIVSWHTDSEPGELCTGQFKIRRTWTIMDWCTNEMRSCTQDLMVLDTAGPIIDCPDDLIVSTGHDDCNADYTLPEITAFDSCSLTDLRFSIEIDTRPGSFFLAGDVVTLDTGMHILTYTVRDDCNNSSICSFKVTVEDQQDPQLSCNPQMVVLGNGGTTTLSFPNFSVNASDNCHLDSLSARRLDHCSHPEDLIFGDEIHFCCSDVDNVVMVEYLAIDQAGNEITVMCEITVKDNTPPLLNCPHDLTLDCSSSIDTSNTGIASTSDNCGASVTFNDVTVPGTCPEVSVITRTWTAEDASGNSVSCDQTITLIDTIAPTLSCPPDVTIDCNEDEPTEEASATDDCTAQNDISISSTEIAGGFANGKLIRWYATDLCGNIDSCDQRVTIQDISPPVIDCPTNLTVECDESILVADLEPATADDVCDMAPVITSSDFVMPGSCPQEMIITRRWYAEDVSGNVDSCDQVITVQDNTPPMISCPINVTVDCNEPISILELGSASATDNCDLIPTITQMDISTIGDCAQEMVITRRWYAEDACGNIDSCDQLITIRDNTAPDITCPANVTVECDESVAVADLDPASATDNCDLAPTITSTDLSVIGACPQEMVITRRWYAEDACGNIDSCDQLISVIDTTPPVITCPADVNLECVEVEPADEATATDNCTAQMDIIISSTEIIGAIPDGTLIRWYATDLCGNIDSCDQRVTIQDITPPVIDCPDNAIVECDESTLIADLGSATADDACDVAPVITSSDFVVPGDCPQEMVITRRWYAEDVSGNIDSCDQVITVQDNTPPVISCPINVTVDCNESISIADLGSATSTDNCDAIPTITSMDISTNGDCAQEMVITRRWYAEDACGNIDSCDQLISVIDTEAPVIVCPANMTIDCDDGLPGPDATATDNCAATVDVVITSSIIPGGFADGILRRWYASDPCGNIDSCDQQLTIEDAVPPVLTCPDNVTVQCDESTSIDDLGSATATDACDESPTISSTDIVTAGDCPQEMVITRRWYAQDDVGNIDSCDQMISVVDTEAPVITCPADATIGCNDDLPTPVATATDNCSDNIAIIPAIIPDGFADGILRRWYARDECGNIDSCDQQITLMGTTEIICPNDTLVDCNFILSDLDNFPSATATDGCSMMDLPVSVDVESNLNPRCNTGRVVRTFTANGVSCEQIITVGDEDPFDMSNVICPAAVVNITDNCNPNTDPNVLMSTPTIIDTFDISCFNLSVDFSDEVVPNSPFCQELTRTWTIIDSCQLTNGTNDGIFTCVQSIRITGSTPIITAVDTVKGYATENSCDIFVNVPVATSDCADDDVFHDSMFADNEGDDASGTYPLGITEITYSTINSCGFMGTATTIVNICDTVSPEIFCIKSLAIIEPSGEVDVPISTFFHDEINSLDSVPIDNCGGEVIATYDLLNHADTVRTFDCEDAATDNGEVFLILYGIDEAGNVDSCTALVEINDANNVCMNLTIAGSSKTEYDDEVPYVMVNMLNQDMDPVMTDEEGHYQFDHLTPGTRYEFAPERDGDFSNGLNTLDLIAIARHMLHMEYLGSPYRQIAADVDGNNSINILDLLKLQHVILFNENQIPENTSWRFVDRSYDFINPSNALAEDFPETMVYNPLMADQMNSDFVAVKIGDVNGSAHPGLSPVVMRGQRVTEIRYEQDESGNILFKASADITVDGYQLMMDLPKGSKDKYRFVARGSSGSQLPMFRWMDDDHILGVTHINQVQQKYLKGDVLFELRLKDGYKSDNEFVPFINDQISPEIYDGLGISSVKLVSDSNTATPFEMYQNKPNPFSESTRIRFTLPSDREVRLSIHNVNGQLVRTIMHDGTAGENEIVVTREMLDAPGLYYYMLATDQYKAVKKLIFTN